MKIIECNLPRNGNFAWRGRTEEVILHHAEASSATVWDINQWHLDNGWTGIGYHYYIRKDGTLYLTRSLERIGAHAKGFNAHSIGICYEGGLDAKGRAKDTRTPEQRSSMHLLVAQLLKRFKNNICICGHRDLSPDLNGDGLIEPEEWVKECPCFEVRKEL